MLSDCYSQRWTAALARRCEAIPATLKLTTLLAAVATALGCGSGAGDRIDVTGRVTFAGAPVPVGRIDFVPAEAATGRTLAGYATIEQGAFNTRSSGRGPTPGRHRVRITGFDDRPPTVDEVDHGPPLFDPYETTIALEPGDVELQFHIPASSDG